MFEQAKNRFNTMFPQKEVLIFLAAAFVLIIVVIIVIIIIFSDLRTPPTNSPTPTSIPTKTTTPIRSEKKLSVIQKSDIEKTTTQELEQLPDLENKIASSDGSVKYTFVSPYITRKNEVITINDAAIFERLILPEKSSATGYARMSDFTRRFGKPQESTRGSRFYGPFITTLIYADKGFAVIGNTHTDEAFEIHQFQPMSATSYRTLYGGDIQEDEEVL